MEVLKISSYQEIESYLIGLGPFDWDDTRKVLSKYSNFALISISHEEFMSCVFLSVNSIEKICPPREDRRLEAVVERATNLVETGDVSLGPNWNLSDIFERSVDSVVNKGESIGRLVLRDLKGDEGRIGPTFKYIHDGCHRSLGYALLLKNGMVSYSPIEAFLATNDTI